MAVKLTVKGMELLQKLQAGEIEKLTFTDMSLGSGSWDIDELASNIDALKDVKLKQAVATKYAETKDDKTLIFLSTTFSNKSVTDAFYVYEVGLYALDGEVEVLYAYDITIAGTPAKAVVQDNSAPQYTPVSIDIGISNIDTVNLTLTDDLSVVSAEQFRSHADDLSNPHKVTKAHVELGNCDNTADIDKPISKATQDALNLKQATGDYATNTALNNGLAGKAATSHNHDINSLLPGTLSIAKGGTGNASGLASGLWGYPGSNIHVASVNDIHVAAVPMVNLGIYSGGGGWLTLGRLKEYIFTAPAYSGFSYYNKNTTYTAVDIGYLFWRSSATSKLYINGTEVGFNNLTAYDMQYGVYPIKIGQTFMFTSNNSSSFLCSCRLV